MRIEDFKSVLYLFSCAAFGKKPTEAVSVDVRTLFQICIANGIWPLVFKTADAAMNQDGAYKDIFSELEKNTMNSLYIYITRLMNVAGIIALLEENGVHCCLLKGATLSELYADPYARISSDTDIYIKDNIDKACKILENNGFEIMDRWAGSHHIKCVSERCGMIELHTEYFDKLIADLWFDGAEFFEAKFIPFTFEGVKCSALNPTDGMLFNFLHFVKHYISGMVTVRQLMDNLLYLRKYRDEIDYEKINHILEALHYSKFLKVCIAFGIQYLQFEKEDFSYEINEELGEETDLLLQDLFHSSMNQNADLYDEYSADAFKKKNKAGNYNRYSRRTNSGGLLKMAKTSRKAMESKYPVLVKYKFLYPFFYIKRAFTGVCKLVLKQRTNKHSDRMVVIKKLGL